MINIVYEKDRNRVAAYDGDKNIGEATYVCENNIWSAEHTFVDSNYSGQGIASKLIVKLVEEARLQNVKIIPVCSFVKREFEKKTEYRDVLKQ